MRRREGRSRRGKHGFTATCNPGGAEKWEDGYSESSRDADVVIVPDNDEAGRKHAELVASRLKGIAKSIRTIKLPIGKDAYDFFAGGGTPEQLIGIIDRAKPSRTFAEQVQDRRWNPNLKPPAIRPVYSIGSITIATPGNLQTICAQAILKGTGPRFKWSDEAGMHVSCESEQSAKDSAKIEKLIVERDRAYGNRPAMRYSELVSTLMETLRVSDTTAERRIESFRHFDLVENGPAQMLVRKDLK